jgi:hypothetical protein
MPRSSKLYLFNVAMLTGQFCIEPRVWKVVSATTLHMTTKYTVSSMKGPVVATINRSSRFSVSGHKQVGPENNSCEHIARMMTWQVS